MVYAIHKFHHYLLGSDFKIYTDHSMLKFLINKKVLGGRICKWLLFFQEYDFEVIIKSGKSNVGLDHLSKIASGEDAGNLVDILPDAHMFRVDMVDDEFEEVEGFITTWSILKGYTVTKKRQLAMKATNLQLIAGQLYTLGANGIL